MLSARSTALRHLFVSRFKRFTFAEVLSHQDEFQLSLSISV